MTFPPQDGDEHGPDDAAGSSRVDPDRFVTEPAPTIPPYLPSGPPYTPSPGYGSYPPYGVAPPAQPYGQPWGTPACGPPSYGQPPYGLPGQPVPAPAAPPQKSKVGLIAVLTGVILVVIAAVVVLVMALQSTVLDASSAERDVAAQFEQREGVAIDLTCPHDMEVRRDATYTCTGKTADGESVTLRLTITDAKTAAYTWTEP
jgi:hypothetical protein